MAVGATGGPNLTSTGRAVDPMGTLLENLIRGPRGSTYTMGSNGPVRQTPSLPSMREGRGLQDEFVPANGSL